MGNVKSKMGEKLGEKLNVRYGGARDKKIHRRERLLCCWYRDSRIERIYETIKQEDELELS
tara:strand:- start:288 stop:470 length:183 start_codon:yes stop_codon:yes gene_type:complete